jgi:RND superfamily putative drug exporter
VTRHLAFPAGRRTKWVVLGVWLLLLFGALGANLPGRFADNEKNESTSFLPDDAESTKALTASEEIVGGEDITALIVYRREGGLTPADRARIAADVRELNGLQGEFPQLVERPGGAVFRPLQRSRDGTTVLVGGDIRTDGEADTIIDPVDAVRERVSTAGGSEGGLQVKVTGGAGFSADAIKVFDNINSTLLLAAVSLVIVLLILIYRSPVFWLIPIFAVLAAELLSRSAGWVLTEAGVTVNGQSSSILSVLVLGAGTDYALLLVARYREELRRHEDKHEAMALALRRAGPAVTASALTVILGLLCLSLASVNGTAGLGPIGALGILCAMLAMLTLLPSVLVIVGRRPFWPRVPHFGDEGADETHGAWRRVGERVARSPRRVWVLGTIALLACTLGVLNFSTGLTQSNQFRDTVESVEGQDLLSRAFPTGSSAPTEVIVPDPARTGAVARAVGAVDGVAAVRPVGEREGTGVLLHAILRPDPYSPEAYDLVDPIRDAARRAGGPDALVGGQTAVEKDLRAANARDTRLIIPLVLLVVFVVLVVLLRAIVAPLLLIASVLLSFGAALGVAAVVFDLIFGFPGSDTSLPLYAFVFLVALGIDYNIFLMTRVREETLAHGTRAGVVRGLAVTGGVITAAGIVLAGTFSVLAVLPLVFLTEIGFTIAFGVLLDTFVVRSLIVPALVLDVGPKVWWPSRLARETPPAPQEPLREEPAGVG